MKKVVYALLPGLLLGGCIAHEYREVTPGVTPVSKHDVISMTRHGYPDSTILARIHKEGVDRRPAAEDIVDLQREGVSGPVMNAMLEAPVTQYRPPQERTVTVVDPEPGILLGIGALMGYAIGRSHRGHVHVHSHHCRH